MRGFYLGTNPDHFQGDEEGRCEIMKGVGVSVAKSSNKSTSSKKGKPAPKAKKAARAASSAKAKPVVKSTSKSKTTTKSKVTAVASKGATKAAPALKTTTLKPVSGRTAASSLPKLGSGNVPVAKYSDGKPSNGKSVKGAAGSTIIPAPPPPRAKPSKNQAGLSVKELETFRDMLLAKRRELVGDMRSMESEALQRSGENLSNLPLHMADMGTDNYEQEFTLGLMEKDRQLLREINQALSKIMDGRYGICEGTGKIISKARLEVQPWAKYSIEHARKLENRGVR
jgi:DnaK suppressor protein